MRRLLTAFLVLLFAMGSVAKAGPVDEQTAKEIGAKYLSASVNLKTSVSDMQLVKTYFMGGGDAAFYVFNTAGSFVIVSAQDVATPILGYSDEGSFDVNDIPEQMEWWLQDYARQIEYCVEENVVPFDKTAREWELVKKTGKLSEERALTAVAPLLGDIQWHQNWPYNKFCPEAANTSPDLNGHTYAGCVACAMSQVMRKWNYPEHGSGVVRREPYLATSETIDLSTITYNWANMPVSLSGSSPDEQIDAVATLMYHAGIAVKMSYSITGSSCNDEDRMANALKTNFLYSDELILEKLQSYTANDLAIWKVKLRSSLDHGFPVFYTAADDHPNSTAGHAFVVDGYNNDVYFHINWGYSGAGDGYFPVGGFNTGGYNYNHAPNAIVNMHPAKDALGADWPTTVFQITVASSGNGTVSGGNSYDYGTDVTVTATANSGYSFAYWKEEDVIVSTDAEYTFTANYDRSLEAYFEAPGTITVLPNDASYGTVTGGGAYAIHDEVTLTATANTGYIFENWTKDGAIVATNNPYTFEADGSDVYVANFMPLDGQYIGNEATNTSNRYIPSHLGFKYSVSEQIYTKEEIGDAGDIYSIALYNVGYSDAYNSYLTDVTRTFDIYMTTTDKSAFSSNTDWITGLVLEDRVFSGEITLEYGTWTTIYLDEPFYYDGSNNLALIICDCTGSTTSRHDFKSYAAGSNTTLYKAKDSSLDPKDMTDSGTRIGEKNKIIINKADHTSSSYTISANVTPEGYGTVTGYGIYGYEDVCTLSASPSNSNYVFRYWTKNGKIMSEDATYSFTVKGNATLTAVFAGPCTVSVNVNPVGTGTVTGDADYVYGSTCTLTAIPSENYAFNKWTVGGTTVSTNETYSFTVTEDIIVDANFRSSDMIEFEDAEAKRICLLNWDDNGDGELSVTEATAVTVFDGTLTNHFKYNSKLVSFEELRFFTGLQAIGVSAFSSSNSKFTTVIMPNTITAIGNYAFSACSKLTSITIPSLVSTIGQEAFRGCSGLTYIVSERATPPTLGNNCFQNVNTDIPVIVPKGSVAAYKAASGWSNFSKIVSVRTSSWSAPLANDVVYVDSDYVLEADVTVLDVIFASTEYTINVPTGITLTVTGNISTTLASQIVVEDGGQLVIPSSASVYATLKKTTSASSAKATNAWYAIASPVNNEAIANFVQGTHNVYRYDEVESEWEEYRNSNNIYNNLDNGRGYLYRSTTANVEFAGDVNTGKQTYPLTYTTTAGDLKGFHLIGNPYPHNIYKGAGTAIENTYVEDGFYKLKGDGTWLASNDNSTAINVNEGILVQAKSTVNGQNLTILDKTSSAAKSGNDQIMFAVENADYSDVAYVLFKEGHGLNKVEHRNADIQMLYVINEDEKFGIADMPVDTKVINLGFEAKTIGQYTLGVKTEGNFKYLHLIDKLTGEDVDMLVDNNYSFMASPTDAPERFIVRLEYSADPESSESSFAYQNGDDIIVTGKGELQIFDVMGRLIMHKSINGVETCHGKSLQTGVYIFKLNEKTQKIFIK